MSALPQCLYCQQPNALQASHCQHCGMPLPAKAAQAGIRRQRRFMGFCLALTLFCLAMVLWLPR
ncbi:protein DnrP [Pseudomonas sp. L5B5]|uniref:protein DnrP n=1 Tax=Pseudomonas sp. L5B5 TaxID=2883205 RepID=UPI000B2EFD8E|nr:protein DnrP [Pseudomonas sp. L5B5]UCZ85760.1 protein DnrP [Pseudomonas sp. L5B5]